VIDLVLKTTLLAGGAWLLTRRTRPESAADGHRLWLLVLTSPLLILAANAAVPPLAFVVPEVELVRARAPEWTPGIYLLIGSVLLARVAIGLWTVSGLSRSARRLPDGDLVLLRAIAGDARLDIRESDVAVPLTAGAVRPCVILPRGWRALAEPSLTAILRHEAAHVRRRDCTIALAAALVEAVFWFNPAVWIATSRLRWFAEMACDASAARGMGQDRYAGELLALAAGWANARSPRYAVTAGAETQVARRIRVLIDGPAVEGRRRARLPLVLLLIVLVTPVSALVRFSPWRPVAPAAAFDHVRSHFHAH
jgi:bla regulator protein BlaR1